MLERREVTVVGPAGTSVVLGRFAPVAVICGPCVIESRDHAFRHAERIGEIVHKVGLPFIFKSSYDKANRTSPRSYRGVGIEEGLQILADVRSEMNIPVITDVHRDIDVSAVAEVVDLLQIPAFLCRQTDLLLAAGRSGKPVMVKKGQMVAPEDMRYPVEKLTQAGNTKVILCERGSCFGYRDLVVDYRGLRIMRDIGCPVVFDATHSVQVMGGGGGVSGGDRRFVAPLLRAAVAVGVDGIFLEAHEDPDRAPSDGPNMVPLAELEVLLRDVRRIAELNFRSGGDDGVVCA